VIACSRRQCLLLGRHPVEDHLAKQAWGLCEHEVTTIGSHCKTGLRHPMKYGLPLRQPTDKVGIAHDDQEWAVDPFKQVTEISLLTQTGLLCLHGTQIERDIAALRRDVGSHLGTLRMSEVEWGNCAK